MSHVGWHRVYRPPNWSGLVTIAARRSALPGPPRGTMNTDAPTSTESAPATTPATNAAPRAGKQTAGARGARRTANEPANDTAAAGPATRAATSAATHPGPSAQGGTDPAESTTQQGAGGAEPGAPAAGSSTAQINDVEEGPVPARDDSNGPRRADQSEYQRGSAAQAARRARVRGTGINGDEISEAEDSAREDSSHVTSSRHPGAAATHVAETRKRGRPPGSRSDRLPGPARRRAASQIPTQSPSAAARWTRPAQRIAALSARRAMRSATGSPAPGLRPGLPLRSTAAPPAHPPPPPDQGRAPAPPGGTALVAAGSAATGAAAAATAVSYTHLTLPTIYSV